MDGLHKVHRSCIMMAQPSLLYCMLSITCSSQDVGQCAQLGVQGSWTAIWFSNSWTLQHLDVQGAECFHELDLALLFRYAEPDDRSSLPELTRDLIEAACPLEPQLQSRQVSHDIPPPLSVPRTLHQRFSRRIWAKVSVMSLCVRPPAPC